MSKNSSVATEKPGTGVPRMVRVNCNDFSTAGLLQFKKDSEGDKSM